MQQATKESLYVPLDDAQKYKAKAFIDMFVDRAAKAGAAFVLIAILQLVGESVSMSIAASLISLAVWIVAARSLGAYFKDGSRTLEPDEHAAPKLSAEPHVAAPEAHDGVAG